jgi:hypothetical protein
MSGIGVAAILVTGAWLGVLTLVVVLLVRQIGLLTVRLDLAGPSYEPEHDGPEVGSPIPEAVTSVLPRLRDGRAHLVLLSATCSPCRELAAELQGERLPDAQNVIALVPGREELADGVVAMLPPGVTAVRDPEATAIAKSLQIQSVPFALQVEDGIVAGRATIPYLRTAADLARFVEAGSAPPLDEVPRERGEVIGHVRRAG